MVADRKFSVGAQVDQAGIADGGAGIDAGAALEGQVVSGLQHDIAGVAALAGGAQPCVLAEHDVLSRIDRNRARRRAAAVRGEPARQPGIAGGDDVNRAVAHDDAAGAAQALGIDGGGKLRRVILVDQVALADATADIDVLAGQANAVGGVDAAEDPDIAVGRDRERAVQQAVHRGAVDLPLRADQLVGEFSRRRRDIEAADIDRAGRANDESLRVRKVDVAADRAIGVGIERAVDVGGSVANDIDQVLRAGRQLQIDRIALPDAELRKRVEGIGAGYGGCGDVGDISGCLQVRCGSPVRNDLVGLGTKTRTQQRQQRELHDAEQRNESQPRQPSQREPLPGAGRELSGRLQPSRRGDRIRPVMVERAPARFAGRVHQNWPGGSLNTSGLLASAT